MPGLLTVLLSLALLSIVAALLMPNSGGKRKAQIIFTHFETKDIASILSKRAAATGSLSNSDTAFILQALFGTNTFRYSYRTNAAGEFLDDWKTPYKIQIMAATNFTIRSAGPNKIFGDADDIVFNSASNNFVKP